MESTFQLLNGSNVTSELTGGLNGRGYIHSSFPETDAHAQRIYVGPTFCSGRQFQRSSANHSCFFGNKRGQGHNYLSQTRVSTKSSGGGDAGEGGNYERLWKKFFADPSQWWNNTINKRNDRAPDFKHKVTGEALWIDNPSTPPWVKAMLAQMTKGRNDRLGEMGVQTIQGPSQFKRSFNDNSEKGYSRDYTTRGWRKSTPLYDDAKRSQNASPAKEAVAVLMNSVQQGISVDSFTYVDVLQRCFEQKDLMSAQQVHNCIIKSGMDQNPYIVNKLVRVYIRCGKLQNARHAFDKLAKKNVVTWTTMIGGYAESGHAEDAIGVYNHMRQEGVQPDEITYLNILKACCSPAALKWGKEIHADITLGGFESDVRVQTALVNMYAKSGSVVDAQLVFDKMVERNVITWTAMIGALAQHGCGQEAFSHFLQMQAEGFVPNSVTYLSILNANASTGALGWVKEVHSHAVKAGLGPDLRVGNALIHMYAKSGSIDDARRVFDGMVHRDIISWTAIIGGLAQHGRGHEAFSLFLQMQREGIPPDATTLTSILSASASAGALAWVKEIHSHAVKTGLASDLRLGNALINMYAKSGSIEDSRLVFNGMMERNAITWNAMIGGLAQHGCGQEAFSLFLQMQKDGFQPNSITYMSILNASASTGAFEWVKEVHMQAAEAGLLSDLRVGNALVHMYAKSGSIDDARLIFEGMLERDVISWTVMIGGLAQHGCGHEAFSLFLRMQKEGFVPNSTTYLGILNPNSSAGALEWVKEVHSHAVKMGLASDLSVSNALVHMYSKSSSIENARLVFEGMSKRDVISWTVMIGGLAEHGRGHEAFSLFLQMQKEGIAPDTTTFVSILNANARAGALEWVKEVHSHAVRLGLGSDLRVCNALIHMFAKCGSVDDSRLVFEGMLDRDVISWNVMIGGLAQHGCGYEAFSLFLQMQREGVAPDATTCATILSESASSGALEWVKEVHSYAVKAEIASNLRVGNALVNMYAKSGSIDEARLVFDGLSGRDLFSWTVMISGLAQHGRGLEALQLFEEMKSEGIKPDGCSFLAVMTACSHAGLVDEGRRQFLSMKEDYGIDPKLEHYNCMVDTFGRAGQLEDAKRFILNMPLKSDVVTWGALLGASRIHNNVEMGEFAARESIKLEPSNASTYVLLSNIYAAAGKWDQVSLVRGMMEERGIRKDPGVSWIEIDNKIHRFVVGDTSHPETKEIYAVLDDLTKKLKAEGYIPDTRLVLRNIDEKDKEFALCSHSEKLAIAYGMIHTPVNKPIRVRKNLRVCSDCHEATKLISKVTGREILARDANRFHHFKDGTCSCGDYW